MQLPYIKGFTFGWMSGKGVFRTPEAKQSLQLMQQHTGSEYVIIALAALQDHPQATTIDYQGQHMVDDDELIDMIEYAYSLGLKVILKPTVNCADGTWRAHINFFDHDVPCEPKWHEWFASYTEYQLHYARIAQQTNCEMLVVGCEMVQSDRRAEEWRQLIAEVRTVYTGKISYNADKYQEDRITWWDAVDVISSSGYYPLGYWEQQLDRIEAVVTRYNKPFFFVEAGCPSRTGSAHIPNDWSWDGEVNVEEQQNFYKEMFSHVQQRDWVRGFGLWDWSAELYPEAEALTDNGYGVYGKPAQQTILDFYTHHQVFTSS